MNTITAKVAGFGMRRVARLVNPTENGFYGYASIGGKKVKVSKPRKQGVKIWTVVS